MVLENWEGSLKQYKRNFQKPIRLLRLLEVEVQSLVIIALAHAPLRCFTFQDFQLIPIIEEFQRILDISFKGKVPYTT